MKELKESYIRSQERLKKYNSKEFIFKNGLHVIWQAFEAEAWYKYFVDNDISESKESFSNCAKIDIEECEFNKDIFSYKRNSPIYAVLSDNDEIINSFSKIDYTILSGPLKNKTYKEIVKTGKSHIYIDSIIKSMNQDYEGLDVNLKTMESVLLKMKKYAVLKTDFDFFNGILNKDKDLIFESINTLSTKEHKKRNKDSSFYKDLISQPAMGYAKIAWRNPFELEFNSPLIHNELLPIKPNKNYTNKVLKLKENMTLESIKPDFNGIKLSEEEFKKRYPKKKNWLQQWIL